ncbi:hypothetical protein PRNP1_015417 [Phytophthora ramorum]
MAVWRSAAFLGMFGDPYLRATPYEVGGDPQALVGALGGLMQLLQPQQTAADDPVTFSLTVEQERALQTTLLPQLAFCGQWAEKGAKVEDAAQFQDFLAEWKAELSKLQMGEPVLVPGGYVGNVTSHSIIYVVEKTSDAGEYSFTVCNKGPGAEMYHPCKVERGADKIRVQSCIQISAIPASRFLDMAFWTLLFSLWVRKPPSEYHRVETIYDVLLPWLAGDKLLPLASETTEQRAPTDWTNAALGGVHTAQRSQLGFCKSVIEAVRYLCLRSRAFTNDEQKAIPEGTLENALRTLSTISLQDSLQGTHTVSEIDPDAVVGIYFAQSTSAACQKLTRVLTVLSESLHAANKKFIVIVVSVDQEQADYTTFVDSLPGHTWLVVPFSEMEARKQLIQTFNVSKVPQLILRGIGGSILTPMGKELVASDPTGAFYPWTSEDFELPKSTLSVSEIKCITMGVKQIGLKTLQHHERKNIQDSGLSHVNKLMGQTERLIESVGITANSDSSNKSDTATLEETFPFAPHANAELLQLQGKESEYAGNASELEVPILSNFLDVPERVTSIPLAVAAFVRCEALCESLLKRAAEGSSSSRMSLHHEVIQLVTSVLVEVLPMPEPLTVEGVASSTCMWRQPVAKDMQLRCLNHLHSLLMILGSVWQSMEQPTRQFDSERALAALCVLCIFDSLIRTPAADDPLEISLMMEEEGGYVLAHTFCKANFSIQKMTSAMEFARPNFCVVRGQVLAYFHSHDSKGKRQLFDYHMPEDKIEVKKYSTTLLFFRQLMERYHYQLIDPNNETPPTEMEALMEWFCSDTTPMADDHPEVGLTRDLVMVVKFLATMETKEIELMRRRTAHQHWQMWQLSFDDSSSTHRRNFFGMRGLNKILHASLKWEVVNFRGSDQDIADVEVEGFMERKVYFGEGPIITSPANLGALLVKSSSNGSAGSLPTVITEDDIMHLTDLPTYHGTLSAEESEYLMSYLTVPYTRIPLVASFFSSRDRVTYLFNPMLQQLFRGVLFEGGDWVSDDKAEEISHIPLRKSNLVMHEEAIKRTFDARVHHQKCEDHLGTMNGLLLNELIHAPEAIIAPLLKMLDAVKELGEASVHSADARFILFMIKLGVDVLRYMTFALDQCVDGADRARIEKLSGYRSQLMAYVFGFAHITLNKWRQEAEEANNLQTACVIHSYLVILHVSLRPTEYDAQKISEMIGSIAYVHNWHCFGMKLSTDSGDEKDGLSAEERLLRWLQAQGIDTANVGQKSLEKYLKGRPLYLKIGMQTIQAPSIVALRNSDGKELQLPPGDVLEAEIFETIQLHRRSIVQWMVGAPKANRNKVLGNIVRIALRTDEQTDTWEWIEESDIGGAGKFSCRQQELKLDAQTGEILWRNDELKPVPDSMTQYADFMAIFGNKSLHCGLVARQDHRLWVNIVGTDFQLVEWDDPTHEIDQGVGAPVVYEPGTAGSLDDSNENSQELKMYWECSACTCANFNGDNPNATCDVCGTPRVVRAPPQPAQGTEEQKPKKLGDDGFRYLGKVFSRPFDIYSEKEHPHADEQWFVDLVGNALRLMYPPVPDDKKLPYTLFLPTDPLPANATRVHLIGLDRGSDDKDKEKMATFKEIVAYRTMQVMHIYALVSHGRRLYRKLIFASNSRLSLHSFALNISPDQGPVDPALLRASGEPTERQLLGGSLVILRKNHLLNGTEQFVPPRLLQGIVPSCLLENFRFWLGEDGRIRGEPVDPKSQWFRYRVEVDMTESGQAFVSRKSIMTSFSRIHRDKHEKDGFANTSQMQPPPAPVRVPGKAPTDASRDRFPPSQGHVEISDDDVVQLMALGFSYAGCGLALRENRNNVGLAAQWLLDENNQMKIVAAEEAAVSGEVALSPEEQHEQNIGLLMSLEGSPSRVAVEYALGLFSKDLELAKAWISDPVNRDEIKRAEGYNTNVLESSASREEAPTPMQVDEEETKDAEEDNEALEIVEETVGETFYLLSMLEASSARVNEEILALSVPLSRVEDLSHILVWCTNKDAQSIPGGLSSIAFIELPRLKLKLQPIKDPLSGRVRLNVMDQNGWFVSDLTVAMPEETSKYLRGLIEIAPDCFVLESDTTDLKLICPNHDLYRPTIRGEPFSSILVSDRGSVGWQQAMETRFYTYPVHSSNTFLLPSSLSSTLYLILTSLLTRNYAAAMELILGCNVDVKFTDEEKRVFDQLSKTLDDRHPNALAQLAMVIAHPAGGWPSSPCDQESVHLLSRGAHLYSKMTVGTMLKHFFDFGEMEFQSKLESEDHQNRVIAPIKAQFSQLHNSAEHVFEIPIAATDESKNFDASNASCGERHFREAISCPINPEFPLEAIDVKRFITFCDPEAEVGAVLPFDLSQHPAAQTVAAKDLLKRLGDDIAINAQAVNESKDAFITGITPVNLLSPGGQGPSSSTVENLQKLIHLCEKMRASDRKMVEEGITMLEMLLNEIRGDIRGNADQVVAADRFVMERHVGLYPRVTFDFLTSLLASDSFEADLKARNPFAVNVTSDLVEKILLVLFLCSRIVHINRTVQATRALVKNLNGLTIPQSGEDWSGRVKTTRQASRDLADMLLSKRYYLHGQVESAASGWRFDPRFLVFEYVFDILLRDRQVQMIDSFLTSLAKGNSRVQQMIMGAGKTTVVGPLLTYILADKEHLVTHVMPTALLEQSRQVLRSRFSNRVLRKRIFTFEFDRAISDDPAAALQMFTKLNRARRHGDVVCASPESIKSMMLKLVELLHSLDESSDIIELPLTSASQNIRRLRRVLEDRSEMADELHKTLRLWQSGILIMDEVDVLLHPLRSELNFPIGNKFPIDLAANRWELPIYLIDAVLATPDTKDPSGVIPRLHAALDDGYAAHTLQRFPHLVLLDMDFYEARMLPLLSEIAIEWLLKLFRMGKMEVSVDRIKYYLECPRTELHTDASLRADIENGLSESSIKLLNLARDWLRTILPHVLSKINRVSYGLLRGEHQAAAVSGNSGGNAHSRLMLAVPFIGKDVPSRSSEFAHPDVLIGLTILAYRYEGIRVSDLVRIVSQLKQDFSRQLGPRDQRPACAMFREWVRIGLAALSSEKQEASGGVLPLPLFQLRDSAQVGRLHFLVAKLAGVVYYYVRQHVFPSCMNFQKLKISACGHELGSNSLFAKRIGFSGTPSNLLPMDLGECYYEPRSDGSIFEALTNKHIVSIERKVNWTARSLLLDIAHAQPPVHALIDTGALITGFDNQEVAAFLLAELPNEMEGVVYLDEDDRQMILLRDHNAPMPLVQCGLSPSKRFTFYDQVHTTGMDIKQGVNARAVVTLGKDMTFRDYAQGAYRMRGIATGQSVCLFLIPEVENRIRHEMKLAQVELSTQGSAQKRLDEFLLLVPAWLLINSMRMESMQLVQLSLQELHNTWRRRALHSLLDEIAAATSKDASLSSRLRRFVGREDDTVKAWLRKCIAIFRVEISYTVDAAVPMKKQLSDVIGKLIETHEDFLKTSEETTRVTAVKQRLAHSSGSQQMLAEDGSEQGETIRRMIHKKHPVFQVSQVQLRTSEGELVESSSFFASWASKSTATTLTDVAPRQRSIAVGVQCLRFFNNEMYYFPQELELLLDGLATVPISLRHEFFECLLRLRRRERHLWGDTPLAKVFTAQSEWHLLTARARLQQFQQSLLRKQRQYQKKKEKGKDPKPTMAALHLAVALRRFDEDEDSRLSAEEVHKCFESFQLGFSSKELNEIIGLIADARFTDGEKGHEQGIPMETICAAFGISRDEMKGALLRDEQENARSAAGLGAETSWGCPVCTYVNDGAADVCGACSEPNPKHQEEDLQRQQQQQGWRCGNCTFINQPDDVCCTICELDMDGQRGVPRGKWVCAGEQGGCTFFNSMSNFYCEVCNRARPDLASTRF